MDQTARRALELRLADLAHEMRTPLNSVLGFAQVLKGGESDETRRAHAQRIVEGAVELDRLIGRMLTLAETDRAGG